MFDRILLHTESLGAIATVGVRGPISAIGPCFISPAAIVSLGVDVGDLLELEGTLKRHRDSQAAAEEEEVVVTGVPARQLFDLRREFEGSANRDGKMQGGLDLASLKPWVEHAPFVTDVERQRVQEQHRSGQRLGARDRYLRAAAQVERAVGHARGLGARRIAECDLQATGTVRLLHRRQRVDGLSRLGHRDDQRPAVQDRLAVAKLRGVVGLGRDASEALEVMAADQRRMCRRAHADEHHASDALDLLTAVGDIREGDAGIVALVAPAQCVERGAGLLVDLLQHEVPVTPAGRRDVVVGSPLGMFLDRIPLPI